MILRLIGGIASTVGGDCTAYHRICRSGAEVVRTAECKSKPSSVDINLGTRWVAWDIGHPNGIWRREGGGVGGYGVNPEEL